MLLDLLRTRRSVRRYTGQPLEAEQISRMLEAALLCPSSKNKRPWHLVVVQNRDMLAQLAAAKPHGASFVRHAAAAIVVCGDASVSDIWTTDCALAAFAVHLEASDLGLASCWVQLHEREHDDKETAAAYVARLLGLPEHLQVLALVAAGYPAESKPPHDPVQLDQVSGERFGQPWRG